MYGLRNFWILESALHAIVIGAYVEFLTTVVTNILRNLSKLGKVAMVGERK